MPREIKNSGKNSSIFSVSLSSKDIKKPEKQWKTPVIEIPGLFYTKDFITKEESNKLLEEIYKRLWNTSLKRRTQHYGYYYDYKTSHLNFSTETEPIPDFIKFLLPKLKEQPALANFLPDQVIINEYLNGQGIAAHIDRISDFGDKICSLSLGSNTIMNFEKDGIKKEIVLLKNSLVILTEDARNLWTHSISARKTDKINGVVEKRKTRVSLTFREIKKKGGNLGKQIDSYNDLS
jgi:alkylated DNA repair dioxygenase AlkB